jgi:hypothetical protein
MGEAQQSLLLMILRDVFNLEYDVMSDTTNARHFGFHEAVDTEEMLLRLFAQFQEMSFIPK